MRSFAFLYFMSDEPDRVRETVPSHVAYWKALAPAGYKGGPFSDRSGGLILFSANSTDDAAVAVQGDPFVEADLLSEMWIKEWLPE